ncbi:fructosamine kinase family protein [Trueperella bialowiezensis]|uniref:Fructosamine-3-kinase n=1 Tax=Trueperella bialowiezensis TaxID=312285 RepID=A0A448PEZ6_9ACTO|nr:fructosamine kinase family protein [Trueperella bialowiezensis]VEI13464.1 Fructosamine-3-kinase [Trueperella bialowiezensis]
MPRTFRKTASARAIAHEVAGLQELGGATTAGGVPVAQLAGYTGTTLETIAITAVGPSREAAREFGARLARTHAFSNGPRVFGQAPATFPPEFDGVGHMGDALLPMVQADSTTPERPAQQAARRFGEFYAADRLLPYVKAAVDNGSMPNGQVIERLAKRLRDGVFDSPQPHLVATEAALLHGDLWSGNVLWAREGAVLIDPACHGGHAESDLAQLRVFGTPFVEDIYAGYHEVSPLADGWRDRIGLHQLHILIVHAALFGGSYGRQTIRVASPYL